MLVTTSLPPPPPLPQTARRGCAYRRKTKSPPPSTRCSPSFRRICSSSSSVSPTPTSCCCSSFRSGCAGGDSLAWRGCIAQNSFARAINYGRGSFFLTLSPPPFIPPSIHTPTQRSAALPGNFVAGLPKHLGSLAFRAAGDGREGWIR